MGSGYIATSRLFSFLLKNEGMQGCSRGSRKLPERDSVEGEKTCPASDIAPERAESFPDLLFDRVTASTCTPARRRVLVAGKTERRVGRRSVRCRMDGLGPGEAAAGAPSLILTRWRSFARSQGHRGPQGSPNNPNKYFPNATTPASGLSARASPSQSSSKHLQPIPGFLNTLLPLCRAPPLETGV